MLSLFESLQFCKPGNIQRKDLFGALLDGKLSCNVILLLPTLHCTLTNLNRGPVNHATHDHLGLTEHMLSVPFLFRIQTLINLTKKRRAVLHSLKNERKINRLKTDNNNSKIFKVKGVSDIAQMDCIFCKIRIKTFF